MSFSGYSILLHINTRKVTHPASAEENNRSPVFGTSPDFLFIDTENTFDKTEYTFMSETVTITRKKGTFST